MERYKSDVEALGRDGFAIVEGVLSDEDFAPVEAEIAAWLDARARELAAAGKIEDLHEDLDFQHRIVALYAQSPAITGGMDIMVMRLPEMYRFLHNPKLLDLAEAMLGPELTCNPIQHLRAKMPAATDGSSGFMNVPWHQDIGVTQEEADNTDLLTFWIPLVGATTHTGCMEVIPGGRSLGVLPHIPGDYGTEIDPAQMPETAPVAAECPRGGVVVMDKYTPHRGVPNTSDIARWTLDLRYQKTGQPTGRPFHPSFVVRSAADPGQVVQDYPGWCTAWEKGLKAGAGQKMHRVTAAS